MSAIAAAMTVGASTTARTQPCSELVRADATCPTAGAARGEAAKRCDREAERGEDDQTAYHHAIQRWRLADPAAFRVEPFSCRLPAYRRSRATAPDDIHTPVTMAWPLTVGYEAGPTGYGLYHFPNDHGVCCWVAAPQRALWSRLRRGHGSRFARSGLASRELAASGEHEREALIVEPGDITCLSTALERLLEDGELRARLGKAARQRAQTLPTREIQPNLSFRRCGHSTPNCRIAPRRSGVRSSHFLALPDKVDLQGVGVNRQDGTLHCQPDK